jgi:membrane protein required for colicin V production
MVIFSSLTAFDIVFVSIVGVSTLFGVVRGLLKSSISLVGWLIAAVIALNFSYHLVPFIEKYGFSHSISEVAAVIVTFVVSAIAIAIFNSILARFISPICGGLVDRSSGLAFGFARGCLISCVLFYTMTLILPDLYVSSKAQNAKDENSIPSWAKDSKTINLLSRGSDAISDILPDNFKRDLKESIVDTVNENEKQLAFSGSKLDNIKQINTVLNSLPVPVLDNISAEDLIILQDSSASSSSKVTILEKISDQYNQYATQKNIDPQQYHQMTQGIEDLITQYNSMINNGAVASH